MDETKTVIAAASYYNKKIFINPDCADIPEGVRSELLDLCKQGAEMAKGVFQIGYNQNGEVIFSANGDEDDAAFDEINARVITDKLIKDNTELIKSIQLWHALYVTEIGKSLRNKMLDTDFFGGMK